jgi:hypothetical protein
MSGEFQIHIRTCATYFVMWGGGWRFRVDASFLVMSSGPPGRVVLGRKVPGLDGLRKTKTRQRLGTTRTDRHRSVVVAIRTVSAVQAGRSVRGVVRSRLKHLVSRAEVCTDRLGVRVCPRLPLSAG